MKPVAAVVAVAVAADAANSNVNKNRLRILESSACSILCCAPYSLFLPALGARFFLACGKGG